MGISLKRFPEHRLDFSIYSGVVTADDVLRHFAKLDVSANWLSYFDTTADLSALDLAHFPALKHALTAKEGERDLQEPRFCLMVNDSSSNEAFIRFWCAYAAEDIDHPHKRAVFHTLEEACDWLGLPSELRETLEAATVAPNARRPLVERHGCDAV